jgi:hypothetical protein
MERRIGEQSVLPLARPLHRGERAAQPRLPGQHHTRFFKMPGRDRKNRLWVFGDAHRERKKFCGFSKPISDAVYKEINGVSGFDQGQREVYARFSEIYRGYLHVPNRRTFKQCTDERVSWNGLTYPFYVR